MPFKLNYSESGLRSGLDKMATKIGAMLLMYAATKASEIQSTMKLDRPWTDRTGMAKATLNAKVSRPNEEVVRITLSHGVAYGIWLELAHEKNFAVIAPTINKESPKVISDLADLMSKIAL